MADDFKRHYLGPITIFLLLFFGEMGVRLFGFPVSVAIPYAVMTLFILSWSGLRASLAMALLISLYPFLFHYEDYGFDRAFLLAAGAFLIAAPSGVLKRALREEAIETVRQRLLAEDNQAKADFVDGLNGNIEYLREINRDLIRLSLAVEMMPKEDIVNGINDIQDKTADLAQRAIGWHQLALDKKLVKGEDDEA